MTRLIFLGTKGEIEESAEKHHYHSSLMMTADDVKLVLDYGKLRRHALGELNPSALLITHAHPDHYAWLEEDIKTDVPVFLTGETFNYGKFTPANSKIIAPGEEFNLSPFLIFSYRVVHSIRCPAVGYRIKNSGKTIAYNPDLVDIVDKALVLQGVDYYIGDGSGIKANLVRRRGDQFFGHTRITTQVNWCKTYGIKNVIFTHLGQETIESEEEFLNKHPDVVLAYDGMELEI